MTKEPSAETFLKEEIQQLKKQEKTTWIVGILLAAFVGIYMTYLSAQMQAVVYNPKILAKFAALRIDSSAPQFISSLEEHLLKEAPKFSDQLVQQTYPLMELTTETSKDQYDVLFGFMPKFEAEIGKLTAAFLRDQNVLVKTAYQKGDIDTFIDELTDTILDKIEAESTKQFQATIDGRKHEGLFNVSLAQYKEMIKYLRKLSRRNPARMTPKERLERRVIVAWAITFGDALGMKFYEG